MKNDTWNLALKVMVNISGWIAFPVIVGLFLGQWLDNKFGTAPWLLLGTLTFSFVVSMFGMVATSVKEFTAIEREAIEKKTGVVQEEKTKK